MAQNDPRASDERHRRGAPTSPRAWLDLLERSAKEWAEDKAPKQAAALAYYTLFAMGPLLLVCIAVAAFVVGHDAAQSAVLGPLRSLLGEAGGAALTDMLNGAGPRGSSLVAVAVGVVALLFGAMGVFNQLKEALNTVFEVQTKPREGFRAKVVGAIRSDALSFAGVMGGAFLLTVTLVVSAGLGAFAAFLGGFLPGVAILGAVLDVVFSLVVLALLFALLFKLVPDVRVAWRDAWVGASATSILFVIGQTAIGFYLGRSRFATSYGAGGAVLLVLLWLYYSSLILVFGAELTQVYANLYGAHVRPAPDARPLQEEIEIEHRAPSAEGLDGPGPPPTKTKRRERST